MDRKKLLQEHLAREGIDFEAINKKEFVKDVKELDKDFKKAIRK